jgi:cell division initiation protein
MPMSDRISAMDVEGQRFRRRFRGFDADEVQLYLKSVAEEIGRLNLEHAEMREKMGALRAELEQTRAREGMLQQTLVAAQRMAEELKEKARAESQLVIKEARFRADQIVREAQDALAQIEGEISRSRLERDNVERRLRSVIDQHLALLDMRAQDRGERSERTHVRVLPSGRVGSEVG